MIFLNDNTNQHLVKSIVVDCGDIATTTVKSNLLERDIEKPPPWYPLNSLIQEYRLTDALELLESWGHKGEEAIAVLRHFDSKGGWF